MTCGVSIPIWTTTPDPAIAVGVHEPLGEAVALLGDDLAVGRGRVRAAPCGELGQVAGQGETVRAPVPRQATSVSISAAAARSAARSWPTTAPSRVLACPGTGALAITSTVKRAHDASTREKSRVVRRVPRTEPDTLERVPAARGW